MVLIGCPWGIVSYTVYVVICRWPGLWGIFMSSEGIGGPYVTLILTAQNYLPRTLHKWSVGINILLPVEVFLIMNKLQYYLLIMDWVNAFFLRLLMHLIVDWSHLNSGIGLGELEDTFWNFYSFYNRCQLLINKYIIWSLYLK